MKSKAALAQAPFSVALHSLDFLHVPLLGAGCLVWLAMAWVCNTVSGVPLCTLHRGVLARCTCSMVVRKWACSKQFIQILREKKVWQCSAVLLLQEALRSAVHRSDQLPELLGGWVTWNGPAEEQGKSQLSSVWQRTGPASRKKPERTILHLTTSCAQKNTRECFACNTSNCLHVFKTLHFTHLAYFLF